MRGTNNESYIPTPLEAHALKTIEEKFERRNIITDSDDEDIFEILNIDKTYYREQLSKLNIREA